MKQYLNLGKVLRHYRKISGLTQVEVARYLGFGKGGNRFYCDIENGNNLLSNDRCIKISKLLYIPLERIVEAKLDDMEAVLRLKLGSERRVYKIGDI